MAYCCLKELGFPVNNEISKQERRIEMANLEFFWMRSRNNKIGNPATVIKLLHKFLIQNITLLTPSDGWSSNLINSIIIFAYSKNSLFIIVHNNYLCNFLSISRLLNSKYTISLIKFSNTFSILSRLKTK